jgi:hypothetical protein
MEESFKTWMNNIEVQLTSNLGWPAWALRTIVILVFLVLVTAVVQSLFDTESRLAKKDGTHSQKTWEFRFFQCQYLTVFLIIMLADWLQGTNMYTLYSVQLLMVLLADCYAR